MISCHKILIVDDNHFNLQLLHGYLSQENYETCLVDNSKEVEEKIRQFEPCLILLDIDMPGKSGLEVCRELKHNQDFKDIPVVFITGSTDDNSIREAFAVGAHDYIRKPVNLTELYVRLEAIGNKARLTEHLRHEEKLSGILEMAGTICHEFNQPLQVISGAAELLMMDKSGNPDNRKLLETILTQATRMGDINRKLMNITRYERCHYIGEHTIIDIGKASAKNSIPEKESNDEENSGS